MLFRLLTLVSVMWLTEVHGLSAGVASAGKPAVGTPVRAATARGLVDVSPPVAGAARAGSISRIADAIRLAEGKTSGVYRYGIRTARSEDHGRRTCLATIGANHRRWIASGARGEFIDFLADRYCPPSVDPVGNANWKRNVRFYLNK